MEAAVDAAVWGEARVAANPYVPHEASRQGRLAVPARRDSDITKERSNVTAPFPPIELRSVSGVPTRLVHRQWCGRKLYRRGPDVVSCPGRAAEGATRCS